MIIFRFWEKYSKFMLQFRDTNIIIIFVNYEFEGENKNDYIPK